MEGVKTKADLKKEAQLKDKQRAENLIKAYVALKEDHDKILSEYNTKATPIAEEYEKKLEPIRTLYQDKLSPINESIKTAEKELIEIGERQKKVFFTDGNWPLDNGYYLHIKSETDVKTGPGFSLSKFVKSFGKFIDVKFKIKELKKAFTDGDQRKKIMAQDIDLKVFNETVELKKKADKSEKE